MTTTTRDLDARDAQRSEPSTRTASRPQPWRTLLARGVALAVGVAIVNAMLAAALVALTGVSGFTAVQPSPVAVFTVLGLLAATVAYGLVERRSGDPRRTWPRVALVALVVSWLPDLTLLTGGATPMGTPTPAHVAILGLLHLPPFLAAIRLLPGAR